MQKIKKFKSEIAQFSQNKANFPPFFLLTFSSGGIPPPQIPPFLLSSRGTLSIALTGLPRLGWDHFKCYTFSHFCLLPRVP